MKGANKQAEEVIKLLMARNEEIEYNKLPKAQELLEGIDGN